MSVDPLDPYTAPGFIPPFHKEKPAMPKVVPTFTLKPVAVEPRPEIDGEKAYPIYRYSATITGVPTGELVKPYVKPDPDREGYFLSSVSATGFFKTQPGESALREALERWINESDFNTHGTWKEQPIMLAAEVELQYWETWCSLWFSHRTFDDGRTDEEYVRSFSNYVNRHEGYQDQLSLVDRNLLALPPGVLHAVCLMGAEDRWRWRGEFGNHSKLPCRCEGCRKNGVVAINH